MIKFNLIYCNEIVHVIHRIESCSQLHHKLWTGWLCIMWMKRY